MRLLAHDLGEDSLVNLLLLGGGGLSLIAAAGRARLAAIHARLTRRSRGGPREPPDREGYVDRDEVKPHYEVFGDSRTTLLLGPTGTIVRSRFWKAQVPFLSAASSPSRPRNVARG
jgi:hypothetical protein